MTSTGAARRVVVLGSGSLARSICRSLAAIGPAATAGLLPPVEVTVVARSPATAAEVAHGCRVRAGISGSAVTFAAEALGEAVDLVARLRPDVGVCCASAQSPYERTVRPSRWTDLVQRAGFGLTLPFQATVVVPIARALAAASPDSMLVNACFPDAVNPLLAALRLPVHCGVGNVASLSACLRIALDLAAQPGALAVLGHHVHLAPPADVADELLVWRGGSPVDGVTGLLAASRALPRRELNDIAGHAAARLVHDLLSGTTVRTNLPGPLGLPGGYPVVLSGSSIALDLPDGLGRAEAIDWNVRAGRRDGVDVRDGRVGYPPRAAEALAAHVPEVAGGWPVEHLDEVTDRFIALRNALRLR
jgi:hypothetical protein